MVCRHRKADRIFGAADRGGSTGASPGSAPCRPLGRRWFARPDLSRRDRRGSDGV